MFSWLKKKPAGTPKTAGNARQIMEAFLKEPTGKSTTVIPMVCKKLRELGDEFGIDLATVSVADEYLHHRIVEIERNYFHSEDRPEMLSSTVSQYCAVFSAAYLTVFEHRTEAREEILSGIRAMRILSLQRRMFRLGYKEPRANFTGEMLKLFTDARASGLADKTLIPYADESESSIGAEFALTALFETAPLQNFAPEQIQYLWRVLLPYSGRIPVKTAPGSLVPFPIGEDGKTYVKLPEGTKAAFYVGPGIGTFEGVSKLAARETDSKKIWEPGQYLPHVNEDKLAEAAAKILSVWKGEEIRRRSERQSSRTLAPVYVAHGFDLVRKMAAFSAYVNSGGTLGTFDAFRLAQLQQAIRFDIPIANLTSMGKDITDPSEILNLLECHAGGESTHRWHVNDRSETGIGLMASGNHPWLVVGKLIALRGSDETEWRLGIVRRVSSKDETKSVGVELLSRSVIPVGVKRFAGDPNEKLDWHFLYDGILVEGAESQLLVPPRRLEGELQITFGGGKRRHVKVLPQMQELEGVEAHSCVVERV